MSTDIPFLNLYSVVRRGVVLILVSTVLAGALGFLGWVLWPTSYDATATLEVQASDAVEPNMQTEITVARSSNVLSLALEQLDGWTLRDLREASSVVVPRDSSVLVITVSAAKPSSASSAATAIASAYLEDRRSQNDSQQTRTLRALESQIQQIEQQISAATTVVRRQALESRLAVVTSQYADARASAGQPGRILSRAETPRESTTPSVVVWLAVGCMGGLLLGVYVASVRERVRRLRGEG